MDQSTLPSGPAPFCYCKGAVVSDKTDVQHQIIIFVRDRDEIVLLKFLILFVRDREQIYKAHITAMKYRALSSVFLGCQ